MKVSALYALISSSVLYIVCGALYLLPLSNGSLGTAMGFGLSVVLVVLAVWAQFDWDVLAFPSLFILAYALYSLVPGLAILADGRMPEGYPVELSFDSALRAVFLAASGGIAFGWGSLLFGFVSRGGRTGKGSPSRDVGGSGTRNALLLKYLFWFGLGAWILGIALNLLDLFRVDGLGAILTSRVERLSRLSEARGSFPYNLLLFPGIALSGYAVWQMRRRTWLLLWLSWALVWIFWLVLQGDRRFLLFTVLISSYVYFRQQGKRLIVAFRVLSVGLVLYLLFVGFGQVRSLLPELLGEKMSFPEAVKWVAENVSLEWLFPQNTEFAGPYFTLLYSLETPDWWTSFPLWGLSYVWALLGVLPRSIYPGEKTLGLSFEFSNYVWINFQHNLPAPVGWGFSPLTETYLNGGEFAIWVVFSFLAIALSFFEKVAWKLKRNPFALGVFALLFVQTLNFQRIDLIWVLNELFWMTGGFAILYVGWLIVKSVWRTHEELF